ncbi:BZ3500_MvSof-1268-A1-R1_Chr6-2g08531 [Microbotryum saponariae]|uniref:BZ3500_MvSof-1268-A1-R1_Chr6-2g08531 protein n=1 Tax=Microbotryum saponariae TaxID=289078 RepID=A0A2X0LQT3_9BASI|nr:BZ3500_MvSof-1268-A1-R1_Chr6-2g08531 [Microbotryum saponariae]SDA07808.1 BZ3501_MvSof-1269-A2-R1_Chr6-1g08245 [Microbotryum saponariae]
MNREDVDWLCRESSPLSPLPSSQEDADADDGDGDDETVALSPTALRSPRSPSPNKVGAGATEHEHDTDLRASKRPRMSTESESSVPSLQLARDATPPPDQARDNDAQQVSACRRDEAMSITPHAPPIATIDTAVTTIPPRTDDAYLQQQYMPANGAALMLQDRVVEAVSSWINEPSSMVLTSYGASQEVRQLQQELGSQDLDDWTPSSQAVPSSPAMADLVSGCDPATDETSADDSGVFVMEPDCAEDDGENCVGNDYAEEAEPVGVDVEAEAEVEASAIAEAVDDEMEDYEGDDMWDTARLDDLDGELGLFQPTTKPITVGKDKGRAQDVDDDEPYLEEENTEEQLRQFGFGHVPLGFQFANSQAQDFSVGTFVFRSKAMPKEISKAELDRIKALLDADDEDDQGGEQPTTQRPVIATRELPAFVPPMLNRPGGRTQGTDRPREMASKVPVSTPQFARPLIAPTSQAPNLPPSSLPLTPHTASMAPSSDVFGSGSRSAAPLALFSRANGRPLPAPSEDALQVSRAMMEFSPPRARPSSRGITSPNPNHKVDTPTKVGRRSPLLSIENGFAPARAVLPSSSIATAEVELPTVSPSPKVPSPVSTAQVATPQPIRTSMRPSSAFRPPFLGGPTAVISTPAGVKTAPAMRRLNLGMTPRARVGVKRSPVPKFTTPFKNGKRPEGLTPAGIARVDRTPAKAQGSNVARATPKINNIQSAATEVVRRRNTMSVFDFSAPKEPRQSLREFGLYPGTVDEATLRALDIPLDIIQMDHMRAEKYAFPGGLGAAQALQSLFFAGCDYATLPWVANHWSLVVWKLASYVRVEPTMYKQAEWWSFQAAIRQLKYRYEREINQAQRSCIKRIQERDSSSSLPMVLCVSKIRYGDPNSFGDEVEESHTGRMDVAGLELTDGWYRIRANVDATLKSAVEREKVKVGSKIAVSGARLENSSEGIDVLEALYTTSLAITGNSTSLARWDARLGFTGHAFTATLRSLSSAGGVVPLLDVIVERVFPRGYIDAGKGSGGEPWNEAEERRRQEEWLNGSAKARNGGDKAAKAMALWDELTDMLREAAETSNNGPETARSSSDDHDPDEVLDRLKEAASRIQRANIVRRLSSQHVTSCLDKLAERAEIAKERRSRGYDVDESMQRAPRNVRSFRVIRIRDALVTDETKSQRTAQLTVWDCDHLGDDFLREGKRYMVSHDIYCVSSTWLMNDRAHHNRNQISNVVPKGVWNLRSSEITLSTRKDAKWKRLAASGVPIDDDVDSL